MLVEGSAFVGCDTVIWLGACQRFEGTAVICSYCSSNDTASPPRRPHWAEAPTCESQI